MFWFPNKTSNHWYSLVSVQNSRTIPQKCGACGLLRYSMLLVLISSVLQVVAFAWAFVSQFSRGVVSSGRRTHRVSSLITSASSVSGLPQQSLPNSHPAESPPARAFYSSGSGLLRVSDSSRPSRLSLSP